MATRILVVEDEKNSRAAMADFLSECGFEVETASSGDCAVEIGESFAPQILICDWMLEGDRDGVSVARQLNEKLPDLVVVFVTGLPVEDLRRQSASLPVHRYLAKPFGLFELNRVIGEISPGMVS
ncbi:MAG: response regulator [Gammaproteobacteria bacterium]|nr:response regulator [Gammaproteobacteria bacterium]